MAGQNKNPAMYVISKYLWNRRLFCFLFSEDGYITSVSLFSVGSHYVSVFFFVSYSCTVLFPLLFISFCLLVSVAVFVLILSMLEFECAQTRKCVWLCVHACVCVCACLFASEEMSQKAHPLYLFFCNDFIKAKSAVAFYV